MAGRTIRKDPPSRSMQGAGGWTEIRNPDPGKRYCWVNQLATEQSPEAYESAGYDYVRYDEAPGGLRLNQPLRNAKQGDLFIRMGHVLMEIPLEQFEDNQQYGTLGAKGLQDVDKIEAYMQGPAAIRALNSGAGPHHTITGKIVGEYVNG